MDGLINERKLTSHLTHSDDLLEVWNRKRPRPSRSVIADVRHGCVSVRAMSSRPLVIMAATLCLCMRVSGVRFSFYFFPLLALVITG